MDNFTMVLQTVWRPAQKNSGRLHQPPPLARVNHMQFVFGSNPLQLFACQPHESLVTVHCAFGTPRYLMTCIGYNNNLTPTSQVTLLGPFVYWRITACMFYHRYMNDLISRKKEWSIAFRSGIVMCGNNTNKYAESTMYILKDMVLNKYVSLA